MRHSVRGTVRGVGLVIAVLVSVTLFQNCGGNFEFDPNKDGTVTINSSGVSDFDFHIQKGSDPSPLTAFVSNQTYSVEFDGIAVSGITYVYDFSSNAAQCSLSPGDVPLARKMTCAAGGSATLSLRATWQGSTTTPKEHPLTVTYVAVQATPTPIPTATPSGPNGPALYASNCASCHGALAISGKKGRSASQITNAIANVGAMSGIVLSAADIAAIATALQ